MAEDNPYLALAPGLPLGSPDDDPYAALIPAGRGKFAGVLGSVDSTETLGEYTPEEIAALEAQAAGLPAPATPLGEVAPTEVRFNSPLVSYDVAGVPDYSAALGQADEGGLGRIGLRALVGRAPSIIANAIEVPATVNEALTRALGMEPSDTGLFGAMRNSLRSGAESVRELGYERDMDAVGYGAPSVSGGEVVDAVNPMSGMPLGERAKAIGTFIPETLLASGPDMAATLNPLTLAGYVASRTNEVAKNRAANDNRQDVTLVDIGIAAPAATVEALLERFTTMRLLPHGTTMATPGVTAAIARIAKELGIQGSLGGVEELAPYLAEGVGTETGVSKQGALETFVGGALAEGAMGSGAQGIKEVAGAVRPTHIPTPTVAPNAAPREETAPAAEPVAPLGEPAPIPQPAPLGATEDTSDIDTMLAGILGDPEVAAALDLPPTTPPADAVLGTPDAAQAPGGVVATPDPDAAFRRPAPVGPESVPDSAFNADSAHGLEGAFYSEAFDPESGSIPLANSGFRPDEIASLEAAGMAAEGAMNYQQFGAYQKERDLRLSGGRKKLRPADSQPAPESAPVAAPLPDLGEQTTAPAVQALADQSAPVSASADLAPHAGKLYQRGSGKSNSSHQAIQKPDGTWMVRSRLAGQWQEWTPRKTFDPSPTAGYRVTTNKGGKVTIKGVGTFAIGKDDTSAAPNADDRYNPLADLIVGAGGIKREDAKLFGVDPKAFAERRGILPKFGLNGIPLDTLRERMLEEGYFPPEPSGAPPTIDLNDVWELVSRALNGEPVGPLGDQRMADIAARKNQDSFGDDETTAADSEPDGDVSAWFDEGERSAGDAIEPGDEAEAATIYDLAERAAADGFGAPPREMWESEGEYAARLWQTINDQEARRGTERETEGSPVRERVPASQVRETEPVQEFALSNPEQAPAARQEVAPSAGLFGAPTARDFLDATQRERDAARDGKTGTGRTDMASGDGELFAGPPPAEPALDNTESDADAEASRNRGESEAERLGLRSAVDEALGKVGEKVIFLHGYEGLPEKQRKGIQARAEKRGGKGRTAALYDPATKNVYVFTNVVRTADRAVWNALHEIAGHEGLRTLLGDGLNRALDIALQNPTVQRVAEAIARERNLDMSTESGRLLAAEEALAELAAAVRTGDFAQIESRYKVPVPEGIRATLARAIDNFLKRLKAAMEDVFGRHQFSDEDVRALLENAWQAVNQDGSGTEGDSVEAVEDFRGMKRSEFLGSPRITQDSNASDLVPKEIGEVRRAPEEPFLDGRYTAKFSDGGAAVFDGEKVIASYNFGDTLVVAKGYRRQGIGEELVYQWRTRYPDPAWTRDRTKASQKLQEKVLRRIEGELGESLESIEDPAAGTQRRTVAEANVQKEATREKLAGELPVSRGTPGWNYDSGAWEGRKGQANRVRTELQDKMLPWRDVQNQIESQLQAALPDAQNVYRIENLMHGRVSEGIDRIERDQIVPLVEAMKAAKVKPETLEEYLYARHAKERNAQIAEINPRMPDGGSGMTNAEADKILSGANKSVLDPLAKRVDGITRSTRKRLLASGLITQEQFDGMEAQYSAYVPLRGKATKETDFDTGSGVAGRGIDSRSKPVKAALGRGAGNRAVNILGEVIGDAQRSVVVAEKARVGRAVMRIVLANPNPNLWTVEPVQTERKLDANGEVYDAVVNDWSDPSIVAVRHKGKLYKVEIQNQPMAKALNNVGVDQLGAVTRAAGAINRYLSAVLTKYNPAFVPVNATRDALFGLTGLAVEKGEAVALEAALSYPKAILAAGRNAANKPSSGEWDAFAKEFAEAGGKTGYVNMPSAEDLARKIGTGKLTSYSPDGMMKAARVIGDVVGVLNDAVENALRLSAYGTLRKRGESAEAAAEYAKNLTVNFNRKGLSGSKLNAWFLFYNAALQGAHRTSKLLRKPKTYAYLGALAGAQVIATMAAMGMADDDGEPLWNKVPDHVKRRNLVIVLPSGHILTIPMPYGFNLFTYMSGRVAGALANNARGDDKPSESAGAITASLLSAASESFLPVPLGDGAMGMLPTVLRIPVNVQTNQNDFGRPIRDEAPFAKSDVPRASMGKPDTLELFKLASTGLNRIGGGDDLTPPAMSWFDRAPEDLEYLLGEMTGGTGQFVVDVASGAQKATGDDPLTWRDVPITKRFATQINDQAAQAALFYDRRETIDRSLKRVRSSYEQEGEAVAEALLASYPELKGAKFKRRKGDGTVILTNGRPQIVVGDEDAVFGRYKAAEKAVSERNEAVEAAYANTPAAIIPTKATRARDANIRTSNIIRETAQNRFNTAWVRDVVGAAE